MAPEFRDAFTVLCHPEYASPSLRPGSKTFTKYLHFLWLGGMYNDKYGKRCMLEYLCRVRQPGCWEWLAMLSCALGALEYENSNCFAPAIGMLVWAIWGISATANEPLWTEQDRLENREMVCLGTVVSVNKLDKSNDLYLAVVEITGMKKGKKTATGSKVNIYYEFSPGKKRCPTYAELSKGEKGTFYLRDLTGVIKKALKIESVKEPAFFLEMGSDVKKEGKR